MLKWFEFLCFQRKTTQLCNHQHVYLHEIYWTDSDKIWYRTICILHFLIYTSNLVLAGSKMLKDKLGIYDL
jgi:hypothetical protein